jgi:2-iminobutanoate/2-iminopropanoate deaminase
MKRNAEGCWMTGLDERSKTYDSLPAPFGKFAHATVVRIGDTKLLFVSGVTARQSAALDVESQTRVVYERIGSILAEEGGGFQHVLKMNVYMTDVRDYQATNKVREEFFRGLPAPASTLVEISKFVSPEADIEIECIAAI